jgi:hypothetical protein
VRFEGPTAAVEEWVGSARHIDQLLVIEFGISVGMAPEVGIGVGVNLAVGVGVDEVVGVGVEPIAQSWLSVEYSVPEVVSTAVVTLPGMMYKLPYATMADSRGGNASIGSVQMGCPV